MTYYLVTISKGQLFIRPFNTKTCEISHRPVMILSKINNEDLSVLFTNAFSGNTKILSHKNFFAQVRSTTNTALKLTYVDNSSKDCGSSGFSASISFSDLLREAGLIKFIPESELDRLFISFYIFNAFRDHLHLIGVQHRGRYISTGDFKRGYKPQIESLENLSTKNAGTVFDGEGNMAGLFDGTRFITTLVFRPT